MATRRSRGTRSRPHPYPEAVSTRITYVVLRIPGDTLAWFHEPMGHGEWWWTTPRQQNAQRFTTDEARAMIERFPRAIPEIVSLPAAELPAAAPT